MKKNKIILGMLVFSIMVIFILSSSTTKTVSADYSDNISIDNVQEGEYIEIINFDGYKIYYAYNDTFHFLFIITPINFTIATNEMVEIRDQNDAFLCKFSPTFQPSSPWYKVKFENTTVEIMIHRIYANNDFAIEFESYAYLFILKVDPTPKSTVPSLVYTTESSDEKDEKDSVKNYISPWGIWTITWMWMTSSPILYILYPFIMTYLILMFTRTFFRPYVFYKNKKGKSKYAGRFAYQKPSEDFLGFWEIYFKRFKKMHKVYSKISYMEQIRYCYMNAGIVKYFSDFIYKNVELSEDMGILYEQELVDTVENKCKYVVYRILSALTPGVLLPEWLKNTLEYKVKTEKINGSLKKIKKKGKDEEIKIYYQVEKLDENNNPIPVRVKKIPLLQHQLSLDKINITCDVEYDIEVTGEGGKEIVHKPEKKKSLFYVEDLKRNEKVNKDKIDATNYNIELIPDPDIERAIMQQDHIDNVRSISDLKVSKVNREYIELDKKYNLTREQLDDLNRHLESKIKDEYYKIVQNTIDDKSTFRDMMIDAFRYYGISGNMDEAIKIVLTNHFKRIEAKQYGQLEFKLEAEKTQRQLVEKKFKRLQDRNNFLIPEKEEVDTELGND